MSNLSMKLSGLDWDHEQNKLSDTITSIDVDQPFSDPAEPLGTPISLFAFLKLKEMFLNAVAKGDLAVGDIYSWNVSKASLLRILSQEDCEMVSFFLVVKDSTNNMSLAMAGRDSAKKLIKADSFAKVANSISSNQPLKLESNQIPMLDEKVGKGIFKSLRAVIDEKANGFNKRYNIEDFVNDL